MKIKLLIGALVFLIVLNLATIGSFVFLQWKGNRAITSIRTPAAGMSRLRTGGRGIGRRMRLHREERQELWRLFEEFRSETAELATRVRELEHQSFALMQRDPVPRDSLDTLLEEIAEVRLTISRKATDKLIEASVHLTPEQRRMFYASVLEAGNPRAPHPGEPGLPPPNPERKRHRRHRDAP